MKINHTPHRRAFVALLPASLLLAAPVVAQEVPAPVSAPPIETTTAPPPPAPAPEAAAPSAASTSGTTARNGIGDPNSATPIDPGAIAQVEESRAQDRATPVRATRSSTVTRATPRTIARTAPATAPIIAAPTAVVPEAAPAPAAPADVAPAPVAQAPVEAIAPAATATTTTTESGTPTWPFLLGALALIGAVAAFFLLRGRRAVEEEYYEEAYVAPADVAPVAEPVAPLAVAPIVAAPLIDTPVATEEAVLVEPEAADVEAITAGDAPVADRPWLEFAMRPVRAGSNADEALVEIELTVGNAGNVAAEDVRISTFMFADGSASEAEMERLLIERGDDGVSPVTIAPGEGARVDATLAMPKRELGDSFAPVVMADARYRLPDGSEGRTSATFTISRGDDGAISTLRPRMHDDVEAQLQGMPEHA